MKKFFNLALALALLIVPHFVSAEGVLDSVPCIKSGANCTFYDVEQGFILITKWMITGVGALALLYFVWGGIQWLTSYGNQEKVRHGREIMLQTVVAIIIAFLSFLMVEFFVNDLLKSEQQVQSDGCAGQQEGKSCGTESNYVCSGTSFTGSQSINNESCISKCQLKSLKDTGNSWACLSKTTPNINNFDQELGLCPGDFICVNVSSVPIDTTGPSKCCVAPTAGESACRALSADELRCNSGEQLFRLDCSEINACQSGYHQTSGCCVSQDTDASGGINYSCQDQVSGEVCETGFLDGVSCDSQAVCN